MAFKEGDAVVIIRGRYRGQECKVIAVDETRNEYVLRAPDSQFLMVGGGNLRVPGPATLATEDVIAALVAARDTDGIHSVAAVNFVADKLGIKRL